MAIKADRQIISEDVSFFCNTVAEAGQMASYVTGGSGVAMDNALAVVATPINPTGRIPAGFFMGDVVNIDLTRQELNRNKDEVQIGSKVNLLTRGFIVTDRLMPGITPTMGQVAYLANSGLVTNAVINLGATPPIGRFLSTKDENGFCKVEVNLPIYH